MRYRVSNVNAVQAGKVSAVIYGLLALSFAPFFVLSTLAAGHMPMPPAAPPSMPMGRMPMAPHPPIVPPWWLGLFFPLLYAAGGFLFSVVLAWLYNRVAARIGGVEVTLDVQQDD